MANKSISQLDSAVAVSNGDLFETAIPDSGSATGYSSKKHSMAAVADHIANDVVYTGLQTTAQTLVAAINEAAESGGGGTNVVANPVGEPTDTLSTVQIGATIYDIEGSGGALDYEEFEITSLTNGTIDTSRGGCWYAKYGNVIHLHLSVKDLTAETTTNVFTMPVGLRPPHVTCMGIGIGADRLTKSSVSVGAQSGACNLWSESTTAVIDVEWMIDAQGGGGSASAEEIFLCSLPIISTRVDTTGTTKKGFYAMENAQPPYQPPQGYKKKYRVSALLNTDDSNLARVYINSELLLSATTWIGGQTSTFLGHFGAYRISDLIDLDDIAKETRYMGGGSQDYYNFYLSSSNNNRAYCENVTLHVYLCKES